MSEIITECEMDPLTPVTVTVYVPVGVDFVVEIVKVELAEPPADSVTVDRLNEVVGPDVTDGVTAADTVIGPEKPLTLTRVMSEESRLPWWMLTDDGLAVIVKSHVLVTETGIDTDRENAFPPELSVAVPVTVTVYVPESHVLGSLMVRTEEELPPDARMTLVGFSDSWKFALLEVAESDIGLEKPSILRNVIVEVTDEPAIRVNELGVAETLKSGS